MSFCYFGPRSRGCGSLPLNNKLAGTMYTSYTRASFRSVACFSFLFILFFGDVAHSEDSSWMEDNLDRFRNNDLTTLTFPASHDAGMYMHSLDKLEIGVDNLHASVSLSGPLVPDVSLGFTRSGVIEAGELLDVFDGLMAVVRGIDYQCFEIPYIIELCTTFGIENNVWEWVGEYYELATG